MTEPGSVATQGPQVFTFRTTAIASADARALAQGHVVSAVDIVMDVVGIGAVVILLIGGYVLLGLAFGVIVALLLIDGRTHAVQQAVLAIRYRKLLGKTVVTTFDDQGIHIANPLAYSSVPWSSVTEIRSNSKTVAFLHEGSLITYVPAAAFASPAEQTQVAASARSRAALAPARVGARH